MRRTTAKIVIIITLALTSAFILTTTTYAKNGPHQGPGMPQDTDACAGCHRAHSGTQDNLIKEGENYYEFCTSCHNGLGANTNVKEGKFMGTVDTWGSNNAESANKGLNGGGFEQAATYTGRQNRNTFANVTSRHNITGLDNTGPWTAYGGGSSGPGTDVALTCSTCHDPHGSENSDGSERYRILKNTVNGTLVSANIESNETSKDYTKDQYKTGISDFCAACHTQYKEEESIYNAGDGLGLITRHRHKIKDTLSKGDTKTGNGKTIATNLNENIKLPVEQPSGHSDNISGNDILTCLTCHQAHGSSASASQASAEASLANSSALLRLNNRGVCQDCHQK